METIDLPGPFDREVGRVTSAYLWGRSRPELTDAARRLAHRLDRRFGWVEVADGPLGRPSDPALPAGGFHIVAPAPELVPRTGDRATVRRERSGSRLPQDLAPERSELDRLPAPVARAFARLVARSAPRLLLLSDLDRLDVFDASHQGLYGSFVDLLNRHGITLVTTTAGRPLAERAQFGYSLTLASSLPRSVPGHWSLVCQWGDCGACLVRDLLPEKEAACTSKLAAVARFSLPAESRARSVRGT